MSVVYTNIRRADRGLVERLTSEHPTGFFTLEVEVDSTGESIQVKRSALLRTARKLMTGTVFVSSAAWPT